nr:hypothetical protein [Tanacetum cinerariifolium]
QDDAEIFNVNDLHGKEVFVEKELTNKVVSAAGEVNAASIAITIGVAGTITTDEITLAQALMEIKTSKPKDKGMGKAIMIEEPVKLKKKDQIRIDEEAALKLQAEFEEEQRLAREKEKKVLCSKAAEEKRNKPPTQAQQRKIMCTYLKNMEGKKFKDLKNKSFDSIKKMFGRAFKRVNTFIDFRTELVEDSSKRAEEELTQRSSKEQKMDDNKESAELKDLIEIIPDKKEVAIDVIYLAVKSPKTVDWKTYKEGKKSYYQIIRADGNSKMYMVFNRMLKEFDREDSEDLYNL